MSWLNSIGTTLANSTSGSALLAIDLFRDDLHELVYICRRTTGVTAEDVQLTTLVLSE